MQMTWQDAARRGADIVVGYLALALSTPFWIFAMVAIGLTDGFPFLYAQTRVGRHGRTYRIRKFRSMVKEAEKLTGPVLATDNDPRITRIGRLLRRTALDEIPQLLSIAKRDMSWVGP